MSAGGTFNEPRAALAVVGDGEPTAPAHVSALRTAADERGYHRKTEIGTCRS